MNKINLIFLTQTYINQLVTGMELGPKYPNAYRVYYKILFIWLFWHKKYIINIVRDKKEVKKCSLNIIDNKRRLKYLRLTAVDIYCSNSDLSSNGCSVYDSYILFKCSRGYIFEDKKGKFLRII